MFFIFDSLKINYQVHGTGETIIILHGWGTSSEHFLNVGQKLATKYQVYLLDLPGFGNSDEPIRTYTLDDYVLLLKQFVTELKIDNPIIIGHSFGGRIGIRYSTTNNVKKLILIDSAGIRRFSLKTTIKIYIYKIKKWFYTKMRKINKLEKLLETSGSRDYLEASMVMKKTLSCIVNTNQRKELKKIKSETLLMWGKLDKVTPYKDALLMKKRIKNSGLVTFDNSHHFPYIEEKYKFIKVLNHYLEIGEV